MDLFLLDFFASGDLVGLNSARLRFVDGVWLLSSVVGFTERDDDFDLRLRRSMDLFLVELFVVIVGILFVWMLVLVHGVNIYSTVLD